MKTIHIVLLCIAVVTLVGVAPASAKTVEVTIGGTGSGGTLALATCVNAAPCGSYVNGAVTGICDCLETVTASGSGTVIAPALAVALNTDAGCQTLGISASAAGNVLTVTGPGTWYLYLRHDETINCAGPGFSWVFLEGCPVGGVANGTACDEVGGGGSGGLDFTTVVVPPGSFCTLNCPAGDGGVMGPGSGQTSPDFNSDTLVNLIDFSIFGPAFPSPPRPFDPCLDFNCDGIINLIDFSVFGSHYLHFGPAPGICVP